MQFAGARLSSVVVLGLRRWQGKASVVLRQILFLQILIRGFVAVDLLPPQFLDQPILMVPWLRSTRPFAWGELAARIRMPSF